MLNNITLTGRMVADPELKTTNTKKYYTSFTLACADETVKDSTDFIECVAWNKTAELISKYMAKGKMMTVVGKLKVRTFKDKAGNNRKAYEVLVSNVYFMSPASESKPKQESPVFDEPTFTEDDFPF